MDPRVSRVLSEWNWDAEPEPVSSLPLLDLLRARRRTDVAGWDLLMIQHHLTTFLPLVRALLEDGMAVDRSWHVDIPYSTNREVNSALRSQWSLPGQMPDLFTNPLLDYSEAQQLRVSLLVRGIAAEPSGRPLLVIDDGAYFMRSVLALESIGAMSRADLPRVVVVEQTTRGERFLGAHGADLLRLGIPAISIASTRTKVEVEGPFIGAAVSAAIARKVRAPSKVAVLGYGVIGQAATNRLAERFSRTEMIVVEKHDDRLRRATGDSRGRWRVVDGLQNEHDVDLVVGCTGTRAFTTEDRHVLADGATLASGSSAAVEFDCRGFVDLADYYPDDEIEILDRAETRARGIHADVHLRLERGRKVTFLNAGFPVNFDGGPESLPATMIQGTRCLIYAAAMKALGASRPGMVPLGRADDDWIRENALAMLQTNV